MLPNYCNASSQRNNLIKLTLYDETKKRAHDSQIVRAKENSSWATVGPAKEKHRPPIKGLRQSCHWVWGLTHRRAIKGAHADATTGTSGIRFGSSLPWLHNVACGDCRCAQVRLAVAIGIKTINTIISIFDHLHPAHSCDLQIIWEKYPSISVMIGLKCH